MPESAGCTIETTAERRHKSGGLRWEGLYAAHMTSPKCLGNAHQVRRDGVFLFNLETELCCWN